MSASSQPRWVIVDDSDSRIQYSGSSWFQDQGSQDNSGNWGPSYRSTLHGTKTNASLSFAFSGSRFIVTGSNNLRNDSGVLDPTWECFVDKISIGKTTPFQFAENNWVFCEQDDLVDGPHVITVNATAMKEQTFWLDRIQYVPSASVPLDKEAIIVDNLDSSLQFGDGWGPLGGVANVTTTPNSIFMYSFVGTSLSWYAFIPTEYPHASATGSYSVDGGDSVNFLLKGLPSDATTTIYNQRFFETASYPAGPHEIVVKFLGLQSTTPLGLDYLIVQNGTFDSATNPSSSVASAAATPSSNAPATAPSSSHPPATAPFSSQPPATAPFSSHPPATAPSSIDASNPLGSTHSSNIGPIVGGVVSGLVLIAIALVAFLYFRRWEKKQKLGHVDGNAPSSTIVEPFQTGPSLPPPLQGSAPYTQYPTQFIKANDMTRHGKIPSQTSTESNAIIPPSSSSHNLPNTNVNQRQQSPSMPSNGGYVPSVNETRLEAKTTAGALRLQRTPPTPPQSASSGSSNPSRLIHHEDSGIRLPANGRGSEVVEVPPVYTPE